jgi:hypothetical protein
MIGKLIDHQPNQPPFYPNAETIVSLGMSRQIVAGGFTAHQQRHHTAVSPKDAEKAT